MPPDAQRRSRQSVFDGDYDEIELRQEWLEENTLHEWDEGEFQLEPLAGHRRGADGSRRVGRALISYRVRGWRPEGGRSVSNASENGRSRMVR